jgi:hypothetical protein
MAWPPPVLPINRTDATPQQTTHAADHNTLSTAVNDLVTVVKKLAPGFVGVGYNASDVAGFNPAWQQIPTVRVDYGEVANHRYLFLFNAQAKKAIATDTAGQAGFRFVHAHQTGWATFLVDINAPGVETMMFMGTRLATVTQPTWVTVEASTNAGWLNVAASSVLVLDIGPYGP